MNAITQDVIQVAEDEHIKRFGRAPNAVAMDRKKNETELMGRGVERISIPRKGKKSQERTEYEQQLWFQDLQRYRAAGEAKISLLKRK